MRLAICNECIELCHDMLANADDIKEIDEEFQEEEPRITDTMKFVHI